MGEQAHWPQVMQREALGVGVGLPAGPGTVLQLLAVCQTNFRDNQMLPLPWNEISFINYPLIT